MNFFRIFRIYQKSSLPGVDTVHSRLQDFYFENGIEFLKTDFTINRFIIFMIFVNFWKAFRDTLILGLFRRSRYFPRYREFIQLLHFSLFPFFSLLPQTQVLPTGPIIKCGDPLLTALNAYGPIQLMSNQPCLLTFLLKRTLFCVFYWMQPLNSAFGPFLPKRSFL